MFRNLRLYRFEGDWPESEEALSERLAAAPFAPCAPMAERSSGFEDPTGRETATLCRRVAGADLMRLRSQSRVLPPAAVREALEDRLRDFRARTGRDASRREKRELKEEITAQLLPRTLLQSERIQGLFLPKAGLLGVDAAAPAAAERFLDQLRVAFGSLKVTPLGYRRPVETLLTEVFLGRGPEPLRAGRECRMRDPADSSAQVTWQDMDLSEASVRRHVTEGLELNRLALTWDGALRCVLDADGVLRKIKLLGQDGDDGGLAEDAGLDEDPLARLDADLTLFAGAVQALLATLKKALGGYG